METRPTIPASATIDHAEQSKLAGQISRMMAAAVLSGLLQPNRGHQRAGITKNKGQRRNKARVVMARQSRRRNRR